MKQIYDDATSEVVGSQAETAQPGATRHWLFALLIGLFVAVVLAVIGAGIVLLVLKPAGTGFSALFAALRQTPLLLLVPVLGFVAAFLFALLLARPLALRAYLRRTHRSLEPYVQQYIPLASTVTMRSASAASGGELADDSSSEEQVSLPELVQRQELHLVLLGASGSGKTFALRVYQYLASQHPSSQLVHQGPIVLLLSLKGYTLFLKNHLRLAPDELSAGASLSEQRAGFLEYLSRSELPGIRYLRPHLQYLSQRGRLVLLCDGLNEVESEYADLVDGELMHWMRTTRNRLVITGREIDYRNQRNFVHLVNEGEMSLAVIAPLRQEHIHEFVERYVERQDKRWQHTAGQIVQVIQQSRLRYHCSNPMMLFLLLNVIDTIGVEQGKRIDTRGLLLREYVRQVLLGSSRQARGESVVQHEEVVRFLSELAGATCWTPERTAIQLPIAPDVDSNMQPRVNYEEVADELRTWLDEHPPRRPFAGDEGDPALYRQQQNLPSLLQQAMAAELIEISPAGVLSFRHDVFADYFVAEYFSAGAGDQANPAGAMREELLRHPGRWSEPVALWAGLLENPMELAERFVDLGREQPEYILSALALALLCVGVMWRPPQAEGLRPVAAPASLQEPLALAVRNRGAREELARLFMRCSEEGSQEIYRSLLPLILIEGIDELLLLLDRTIVVEILFTHLLEAVDSISYDAQVRRLTRILGRFGSMVVERAAQLSLPLPERSMRLRAAAINMLGGTHDARAVAPLIERLSDTDAFIVDRATNALIRLGPELALAPILQALESRAPGPFAISLYVVHRAALSILARFLNEQDVRRQLSLTQYTHTIEAIVSVLTPNYQAESEVQQLARQVLIQQARDTTGANARDNRWEKVIDALIRYLPSQNPVMVRNVILVLQEIGPAATPALLQELHAPSEVVRARVLEIVRDVRDPDALPSLLRLMSDPSIAVQQQVAEALYDYAPQSIPGLIDLVLTASEEMVAESAAQLLERIGEQVVVPIINVLFHIVPGRTRLLVRVLERIHDPQCVPALITLLQAPHIDPLLTVAVVRALSGFPEKRVVPPLLALLSEKHLQISEEAIDALSLLGPIAFDDLLALLERPIGELAAQRVSRVRRAFLGMTPFPGKRLIDALVASNEERAEQIVMVLKMQGADAARAMTRQLLHSNERVRGYLYQALSEMPGSVVVPALLEALEQPPMRRMISTLLLTFPDTAIPPLVELLAEPERGDAAAAILPRFGTKILVPLVAALDDQRYTARERARRVLVTLARQSDDPQQVLQEVIALFTLPPPSRARETLLEVLTDELAGIDTPALLAGLEDAHLIEDVAEAFLRLSRIEARCASVITSLLESLSLDARRRGAERALVVIGAPAVAPVGELITSSNQHIARSAKNILRDIGVAALPFIWSAHSDKNNPARRAAALEVFHSMRTEVIKDEMVALLLSDRPDDIAIAVALLMERIRDEEVQHYADRTMVPELIEYIQTNDREKTNLRLIGLLLLLDEQTMLDHLLQALDDYPQHRRQLLYVLLLLGPEAHEAVLAVFEDPTTTPALRAELAAVLGMTSVPDAIVQFAQNISAYGVSATKHEVLFPDELSVSLRALGGLLASGQWNADTLQELRDASREGSPARELFSILLGMRYSPQITKLQSELQKERDEHTKETLTLSARIVADQKKISELEEELEQMRREHGDRSTELDQTKQDRARLNKNLDQVTKERNALQAKLDQVTKEKNNLQAELQRALKEKKGTTP